MSRLSLILLFSVLFPLSDIQSQMLDYIAREFKSFEENQWYIQQDTTFYLYSNEQNHTIQPLFNGIGLLASLIFLPDFPGVNYDETHSVLHGNGYVDKWSTVRFKSNGKIDSSYSLTETGFIRSKSIYTYDTEKLLENETQFSYDPTVVGWTNKRENILEYKDGLLKKRTRISKNENTQNSSTQTEFYQYNIQGKDSILISNYKKTNQLEQKYFEYHIFYNSNNQLDSIYTERYPLSGDSKTILTYKHFYENDNRSSTNVYVFKDGELDFTKIIEYIYNDEGRLRTTEDFYTSTGSSYNGYYYDYDDKGNLSRVSSCPDDLEDCSEYTVLFYNYSEGPIVNTIELDEGNLSVIYPNPVSGSSLSIRAEEKIRSVDIISATGNLIFSSKVQDHTIDISQLNLGFYIIKVNFDQSSETHSFVRN